MSKRVYLDKNGNQIKEGDRILFLEDNSEELVYKSEEGELGINASNEAYLKRHCCLEREIYPLYQFDLNNVIILEK